MKVGTYFKEQPVKLLNPLIIFLLLIEVIKYQIKKIPEAAL